MTAKIAVRPGGPVGGTIRPPGSKSITNRALVCAALADKESVLTGALRSEDTDVMIAALRQLGVDIQMGPTEDRLRVVGCGGQLPAGSIDLDVANSGTTARFLTAVAALGRGVYRLDGSPRMRERPIQDLLDALARFGVDATSEYGNGCPPVIVRGQGLRGGQAQIASSVSSQFTSALLMAAPCAETNVALDLEGQVVSRPYLAMTIAVMASFGVCVTMDVPSRLTVPAPQRYLARHYAIEPDASAASYFFAAAAITGGNITVEGLSRDSLQGDIAFCLCLQQMGCDVQYAANHVVVHGRPLHGIDMDMVDISDTAPTLAAVALFAKGSTTIRGVAHMRRKETDRVAALATELRRLGGEVEEYPDGMRITPRNLHGAEIETYNDHRMAMSLALVGLTVPDVVIRNPGCVAKTYPRFFEDLESIRETVPRRD